MNISQRPMTIRCLGCGRAWERYFEPVDCICERPSESTWVLGFTFEEDES